MPSIAGTPEISPARVVVLSICHGFALPLLHKLDTQIARTRPGKSNQDGPNRSSVRACSRWRYRLGSGCYEPHCTARVRDGEAGKPQRIQYLRWDWRGPTKLSPCSVVPHADHSSRLSAIGMSTRRGHDSSWRLSDSLHIFIAIGKHSCRQSCRHGCRQELIRVCPLGDLCE